MSRYINADAFDERVRVAVGFGEEELTEDFKDGVRCTLDMLKTQPTADVRENVHGEWMPIIEGNEFGEAYQAGIYCSECGETLGCEANFCPNCGADMRGEG